MLFQRIPWRTAANPVRRRALILALSLSSVFATGTLPAVASQPEAVPTFNCLSLYWAPTQGAAGVECRVEYWPDGNPGAAADGQSLWFDPVQGRYKGSIVDLEPDTAYTVGLTLVGPAVQTLVTARTWSEDFPISQEITLPALSNQTLVISQSGSPNGYILYTFVDQATGATIDVARQASNCIFITNDTSHIIIRGLTLRGATTNAIELGHGVSNIVVEDSDISGWGSFDASGFGVDTQAAVWADWGTEVERIIVQNNHIHHPFSDSNDWHEHHPIENDYHPRGPQAVALFNSKGNHVIRYNSVYTDDDHRFNDIFGAGANFGTEGFPNKDSDIYGNYLSRCWDDAIESEGANENVRIWGNFIEDTFVKIAVASTTKGPVYVFRNVSGIARVNDRDSWLDVTRGGFLKTKDLNGGGRVYVYHNTIWQPPPLAGFTYPRGCSPGLGHGGPMLNTVSRNNILHVYRPWHESISDDNYDPAGDYDYDLYNGIIRAAAPSEVNGLHAEPIYALAAPWDPVTRTGDWSLTPASPGFDQGVRLPNFNDGFAGNAPDIGAHEAGAPRLRFGVNEAPEAAIVCAQLTDIGAEALVRLDSSGSSDPEGEDLIYAWFVDGASVPCPAGPPENCAVIEEYLTYGEHDVLLRVTDPEDATDEVTKTITIDPANLSVLDIDKAKVKFNTCKINLKGEIGLPFGVSYAELDPLVTVGLSVSGTNVLPVPMVPVLLDVHGGGQQRWKFRDDEAALGITHLDLDWNGARFRFKDFGVELKSQIITSSETVLSFKYKINRIGDAFTLAIDGREIAVDADGHATTTATDVTIIEEEPQKEVTLTLDFPLLETSTVELSGAVTATVDVPDSYDASIGRFRLKTEFDASAFPDGAGTLPRTVDLILFVGAEGYTGEARLGPQDLRQKSHEWKR